MTNHIDQLSLGKLWVWATNKWLMRGTYLVRSLATMLLEAVLGAKAGGFRDQTADFQVQAGCKERPAGVQMFFFLRCGARGLELFHQKMPNLRKIVTLPLLWAGALPSSGGVYDG